MKMSGFTFSLEWAMKSRKAYSAFSKLAGRGKKEEGVGSSAVKYLTRLSQEGKCIGGGTGTPVWLLAFWHYSSCLPDAHVCRQDLGNGSRGDNLLQTGKKAERVCRQ